MFLKAKTYVIMQVTKTEYETSIILGEVVHIRIGISANKKKIGTNPLPVY